MRRARVRPAVLLVLAVASLLAFRLTGGPNTSADTSTSRPPEGVGQLAGEFRDGLRSHPADPTALRQLAQLISLEDRERGLAALSELAAAYPSDATVHSDLARAWYAAGDRARALAEARLALALDPSMPEALLLRGRLLASGEHPRIGQAERDWLRVVQVAPGTREAREAGELLRLYDGR